MRTTVLQTTSQQIKSILLVGGCHVCGFEGHETASLTSCVQERLDAAGSGVHVRALPHTRLPHRRRIVSAIKGQPIDLVLLQLGHAELNQALSAYLRSRFYRRTSSSSSDESDSIAYVLAHPRLYYFRAAMKALADRLLFHPLVNWVRLCTQLDLLLSDLKSKTSVPVLLLSPMPCADPTRMYYRRRALPMFRAAAVKYGFDFFDVLSLAPSHRQHKFGPEDYFWDAIHLGAAGQRVVGSAIAEHLLSRRFRDARLKINAL